MKAPTSPPRARLRLVISAIAAMAVLAAGGAAIVGSVTSDDPGPAAGRDSRTSAPSPTPGASAGQKPTPGSGRAIPLVDAEKRHSSGMSVGFPHTSMGAMSAAVRHQEELDLVDDGLARQQLRAIAVKGDPAIERGVSKVRRTRESADLAPSGGPPSGVSFSTEVTAVRTRSLDDVGDVIEVWMAFNLYAQVKDKATDSNPLTDEMTSAIYTWSDGDWQQTAAKRWSSQGTSPRAYDPASPYAWADGWREVAAHG
jgi:hypothetical protein